MRTVLTVIAFAFAAGKLAAQPTSIPPGAPPSALPAGLAMPAAAPVIGAEPVFLPGGKDVSRPLTMVEPPAPEPKAEPTAVPEAKEIAPECVRGPLGPSWANHELLFWWPMRQPVPPLVVATRSGAVPTLGGPESYLLVGNRSIDTQPNAGGRFTLGHSINKSETAGYEIVYFFLGTRTYRDTVSDLYNNRTRSFGLPYTNAVTGQDEVLALARPGESSSLLVAATSVRVQGWEVNGVTNLHDGKYVKLNGLAGWRYFQVHEGLRLEQNQLRFTGTPGIALSADQFDAHNRFHGGQLGLHADMNRGALYCEMTAKIAFGQTYEVVKAEGMTHLLTPGSALQTFGGSGIYVQPSNAGRSAGGVFAVVPEGTLKIGFRLGDAGRVYLGYSFLYLSDAVRPGEQIDRTLNPAQVPLVSGIGPVYGADRPRPLVSRSDFWAQGLVIGLETRY